MKILSLCLLSLLPANSAQIWTHPNVEAALPVTPLTPAAVQLNIASIEREFPQNYIWVSGNLIGYFPNEWRAPVWTTFALAPPEYLDESPRFEGISVPTLTVPPLPIPPMPNPPVIHVLPPAPAPFVVQSNVPEPGFLTLWPLWIICGAVWGVKRKIRS